MRSFRCLCIAVAALLSTSVHADAQVKRPAPTITTEVPPGGASPGAAVRLRLRIVLPSGLHVQSDKPRDPSLIPAKLSLTPPSGVSIVRTTYPTATDLAQPGGTEPLAVFSGTFTIDVDVAIAKSVQPGTVVVPGELRYQLCTDQVCFPPSRATVTWRVKVKPQ